MCGPNLSVRSFLKRGTTYQKSNDPAAREKNVPRTLRLLLTCLSALFFSLSFPDRPFPALAFFCLVPLGVALKGAGARTGLCLGFLYGFIIWLTSVWWLAKGLYLYVQLSHEAAWLWTVLGCFVSALPYAAFGLLCGHFKWMDRPFGLFRCAACLTVFISGFPYLFPGNHAHSLYHFPWAIQILDLGGVPVLLFALNGMNFLMAGAIVNRLNKQRAGRHLLALVLVFAFMAGYGIYRLGGFHREMAKGGAGETVKIAAIQPNFTIRRAGIPIVFGTDHKINDTETVLKLYAETIRQHPDARLIVWPELPTAISCAPQKGLWPEVRARAKASGIPVLVNCSEDIPAAGGQYNCAQLILKTGEFGPRYRKSVLFPFGEYLPLEKEFSWMRKLFPSALDYIPGKDTTLLPFDGHARIIAPLCYEVLFSGFIREFVEKGGDIIVNMVDDAWFGQSDASAVHMALAVYRAVEYRIPLVRVTNSGNGVFVQPTGEIVPKSRTPLFQEVVSAHQIYIPQKRSPYFRLGDFFVWILALIWGADILSVVWLSYIHKPNK